MNFSVSAAGKSSILLYGPGGQQLSHLTEYLEPGEHEVTIALRHPGVHFLRLQTPSGAYDQALLCLAETGGRTGLQYFQSSGGNGSFGTVLKSSPSREADTVILVKKGDLLRFCAYSASRTEMWYDQLTEDSTYQLSFPQVPDGVHLRIRDSIAADLDTIYCHATREGCLFSVDQLDSVLLDWSKLQLQPVSSGGSTKPEFAWEIENEEVWMLDTSAYGNGDLLPVFLKADTSRLMLHDLANNFSKAFVMILVADDFVASGVALTTIKQAGTLNEISGMAASIKNPGCFWVHNDSGDDARLYLINKDGRIVCFVNLMTEHTDNRDWEDIAVGPGPAEGESYIYIGEIGDLGKKYSEKYIFRIVEPEVDMGADYSTLNIAGSKISTITFDYADGPRDAEILLIDPDTKDLYVITKREDRVQVYLFAYPQNYEEKIIIERSSVTLPFRMANGGDISADGREILLKNLTNVYYWKREEGESVLEALARPPEVLPYTKEPQGEAIGWFRDGSAYLTVSEKKDGITPVIYLYKRSW